MTINRELYFLDNENNKRFVCDKITEDNVLNKISKYVKKLNPKFKIYYYRNWNVEIDGIKVTEYDVGSYSEFFYVIPAFENKTDN